MVVVDDRQLCRPLLGPPRIWNQPHVNGSSLCSTSSCTCPNDRSSTTGHIWRPKPSSPNAAGTSGSLSQAASSVSQQFKHRLRTGPDASPSRPEDASRVPSRAVDRIYRRKRYTSERERVAGPRSTYYERYQWCRLAWPMRGSGWQRSDVCGSLTESDERRARRYAALASCLRRLAEDAQCTVSSPSVDRRPRTVERHEFARRNHPWCGTAPRW